MFSAVPFRASRCACLLVALAACETAYRGTTAASAPGGQFHPPTSPFPTPATLERIAARPTPAAQPRAQRIDASDWTLEGPFPAATGARQDDRADDSPWTELLRARVAGHRGVRVTSEMGCAAREIGRFALARGGLPPVDLEDFILARCGAGVAAGQVLVSRGNVPRSASTADVLARWRDDAQRTIDQSVRDASAPTLAGIWFGRHEDTAALVFAFAPTVVEFTQPVAPSPDGSGNVVLEGRVLTAATRIAPWITQGAHGAVQCHVDPAVQIPAFRATCPTRRDDAFAWIDLSVSPPQSVLAQNAGSVLVWPSGTPSSEFVRLGTGAAVTARPAPTARAPRTTSAPTARAPRTTTHDRAAPQAAGATRAANDAAPAPGATGASGDAAVPARLEGAPLAAFVDALNAVRAQDSIGPLVLEPEESTTSCRVAPHLLSVSTESPEIASLAALGLLAGWQVHGRVREGWFGAMALGTGGDANSWLAVAMQHPFMRASLMQRDAGRVALCVVSDEADHGLGVVWSTYALADDAALPPQVVALLARIAEQRAARRLPPPMVVPALDQVAGQSMALLTSGSIAPDQAMNTMLENARNATSGHGVAGYMLMGLRFETLNLPPHLLDAPTANLGIAITYWRAPGVPWSFPLAMVVALTPDAPALTY